MSDQLSWDHNAHYHDYLLRQLPDRVDRVLDVGSGTGAFARRLHHGRPPSTPSIGRRG